jgi:hypothetical protein
MSTRALWFVILVGVWSSPVLAAAGVAAPVPTATPATEVAHARDCSAAIAGAAGTFVKTAAKLARACTAKVLSGKLPRATVCRDEPATVAALGKATIKLASRIAKACGGKDKRGGSGDDDVPLADVGWQAGACPGIIGGACTAAIADCGDVASCLACIGTAAADGTRAVAADAFVPTDPKNKAEKPLYKCQGAIARAALDAMAARSAALAGCWQRVGAGRANGPCPADEKTTEAIAKAVAKSSSAICKACGGGDRACRGADDRAPGAIGFVPSCPDVHVPGAPACGHAVATLGDLTECVACTTGFDAACATLASVPAFATYPAECRGIE